MKLNTSLLLTHSLKIFIQMLKIIIVSENFRQTKTFFIVTKSTAGRNTLHLRRWHLSLLVNLCSDTICEIIMKQELMTILFFEMDYASPS